MDGVNDVNRNELSKVGSENRCLCRAHVILTTHISHIIWGGGRIHAGLPRTEQSVPSIHSPHRALYSVRTTAAARNVFASGNIALCIRFTSARTAADAGLTH